MAPVKRFLARLPLTALIVALAALCPGPAQAQKLAEYQVKAAYLYGFGRFVEWPASAPAAGSAFVVCVLGDDPFGPGLDEVAAGAVMKDRRVTILRISRPDESASCHTLFISASEDVRLGRILEAVGGRPVLTVSDAPRFAQRGGMIGFVQEGGRVRFAVNLAAAQEAGLMLNSELLRVAATVLRTRQPGE
jgi:hypothetical protein